MQVVILAYAGCLASAVSGFCDVLALAGAMSGERGFTVRVCSLDGQPVSCFADRVLAVDGPLDDSSCAGQKDAVVYVPPAFGLEFPDPALVGWIAAAHGRGLVVCAACAGVFFLAAAGVVRGRVATTHWALVDRFRSIYPDVVLEPERMLVDGGDYVCAGGVTAYLDLALHLVARFLSPQLAVDCARTFLVDAGRASQTPYMNLLPVRRHADELVDRACQWLEVHYVGPVRLHELAHILNTSERTLQRRFRTSTGRTPAAYLQALRVEQAKRLLETGTQTVSTIAGLVGYGDVPAFTRTFRSSTGLSPGEYRRRFSPIR